MSSILGDYVSCFFEVFDAGDIYEKVMIGCQLELEIFSGEGCAPEILVVSRRESMIIELTKHIFCWLDYTA